MKKLIVTIAVMLLIAISIACAAPSRVKDMPTSTYPGEAIPMPAPAPPREEGFNFGPNDSATTSAPTIPTTTKPMYHADTAGVSAYGGVNESTDTDRMIVRTGNISLIVEDINGAIDKIKALTDSFKGYVVSSSSWKEGERLIGNITIRVPAESYDEVMKTIRGMAVEVTSETSSSKDVTEEYIDLEANLRNLQITEEQLIKLMAQASNVDEILNVQRELSKTRGEIEQTKGRMQYLERTSATSLIEVSLAQSKLDVKFSADRRFINPGEQVWFIPEIAGGFAPYSYEWNFGNGDTSNNPSPGYAYRLSGKYTVSLKVTDDKGNEDIETMKDYINVASGWNAGTTASSAWGGFITFGQALVNILIWIGIFSPVWIVIGFLVYWFWWRRRKKV